MHRLWMALLFVGGATLTAQEPTDSLGVADSAALRAARDSLAAEVARELGLEGDATRDSVRAVAPPAPAAGVARGPAQPFNPDISVIGDFLADLSPDDPALEEGDRFLVREVEVGLQAVVDPYLRGDFFLALKEGEIELEEGYLTTLALPSGLQARAGRFHLPFGKVNLTHRPELHTIEYPRVVEVYFGEDGFASTGLWGSKILAPLGFYQEVVAVIGNDLGEAIRSGAGGGSEEERDADGEAGDGARPDRDLLDDLGNRLFLGHVKSYADLSDAANVEVGLSAATGEDRPGEVGAERLTFWGVNATLRWRPPAAALYRSLIVQAEAVWREGRAGTDVGAFAFGQWQLGRRWYVGGRFDVVEHPEAEPSERETSISGYLTHYPSEFSLFRLGVERRSPELAEDAVRILLQATVTLGPHRPHPF